MGGLRIAGIAILIVGILVIAYGYTFKMMHWYDPINGRLIGSVFLAAGLIFVLISILGKK